MLIFSHRLTYELSDGPFPDNDTSVYSILNWREDPSGASTATIGAMIGGFLAFTTLCWGMYRMKSMISGIVKIGPLRIQPPPPSYPQNSYEEEAHEADESESAIKVTLLRFEAVDDRDSVGRSSFMSASSIASSAASSAASSVASSVSAVPSVSRGLDQKNSRNEIKRSSAAGRGHNYKKDIKRKSKVRN